MGSARGANGSSALKKNFIIDTNVLLHDPGAVFAFEENNVIIPIYVIEEIDKFKRDMNELGRSARGVSRTLDELRAQGNLAQGVGLPAGGSLRVAFTGRSLPNAYSMTSHEADSKIIAVALDVKESTPETPTILVTKDVNLRIRADALGLADLTALPSVAGALGESTLPDVSLDEDPVLIDVAKKGARG